MQINQYKSKNYHSSRVQIKQQTREEEGGDNFEMKDFRAERGPSLISRLPRERAKHLSLSLYL
jgi:hypothetical protein